MSIQEVIILLGTKTLLLSVASVFVLSILFFARCRSPKIHQITWALVILLGVVGWGIPVPMPLPEMERTVFPVLAEISELAFPVERASSSTAPVQIAIAPAEQQNLTVFSRNEGGPRWQSRDAFPFLFTVWCAGMLTFFCVRLALYGILLRKLKECRLAEGIYHSEWKRVLAEYRLSPSQLPLYLSDDIGPGLLWRFQGSVVVVPTDLWEEATDEIREDVLRHELEHYRNGDIWRLGIARMLVTFHWFNPLAWLALYKMNEATEWLCDLATFGNKCNGAVRFANSLLAFHDTSRTILVYSNSFAGGVISRRVRQLHSYFTMKRESFFKSATISVMLVSLLLFGLFQPRFVTSHDTQMDPLTGTSVLPETLNKPVTSSSVRVFGTVVDAVSGEPISAFHISECYILLEYDKLFPSLDSDVGMDGAFHATVSLPQDGITNVLLRIEAEGYEPLMSLPVHAAMGQTEIKFALKKR